MRKLGGGCEDDLPEDIDEAVFADANAASIDIVPMKVQDGATSQDEEVIAVGGTTFPFKDWLKTKGFSFANTVNGHDGAQLCGSCRRTRSTRASSPRTLRSMASPSRSLIASTRSERAVARVSVQ